jgi:hypothetical protein
LFLLREPVSVGTVVFSRAFFSVSFCGPEDRCFHHLLPPDDPELLLLPDELPEERTLPPELPEDEERMLLPTLERELPLDR